MEFLIKQLYMKIINLLKKPLAILGFCSIILLLNACNKDSEGIKESSDVPPLDKSIAPNPPMGWNSWDCFGWTVNETQVKANADFIAKNLKHLGYEYVVIDATWYGDAEGFYTRNNSNKT
jgi:hypothetical protein